MPNATVNFDTERHDLKTLPGGFVELKRMSYGQVVERRSMLKLSVAQTKGSKDFKGEMAMANREITMFEFKVCIVNHNLTDANDRQLNLGGQMDFTSLDPRVGQEIESLISDMNNFEDDDQEN